MKLLIVGLTTTSRCFWVWKLFSRHEGDVNFLDFERSVNAVVSEIIVVALLRVDNFFPFVCFHFDRYQDSV